MVSSPALHETSVGLDHYWALFGRRAQAEEAVHSHVEQSSRFESNQPAQKKVQHICCEHLNMIESFYNDCFKVKIAMKFFISALTFIFFVLDYVEIGFCLAGT